MAVNRPASAVGTSSSERPAPRVLVSRRLVICGLGVLLAAGCAAPWQSSRAKASSPAKTAGTQGVSKTKSQRPLAAESGSGSQDSQVKDVKQFVGMPRVGLPFDEKD